MDLRLIHGSLGYPSHTPNGISIAVELFLQGSRSWQTNSPSVARRCIAAMRPNNVQITFISYNICWKITKLLCRNTYHRHRPAVASSSHRSRQVASLTHYLHFSTAAITRRPCCRRELPRDAGHLYRKLAPNPRAIVVNRNISKAIDKHGKVVDKPLYKCISKRLMHVAV